MGLSACGGNPSEGVRRLAHEEIREKTRKEGIYFFFRVLSRISRAKRFMHDINETHDPNLKIRSNSAKQDPNTDFPIQNLPWCIFRRHDSLDIPVCGVCIGDFVFDLERGHESKMFPHEQHGSVWSESVELIKCRRLRISEYFAGGYPSFLETTESGRQSKGEQALNSRQSDVEFFTPFEIATTRASIARSTTLYSGRCFRGLMPNYKYLPIGYHGHTSSIVISGTDEKRTRTE